MLGGYTKAKDRPSRPKGPTKTHDKWLISSTLARMAVSVHQSILRRAASSDFDQPHLPRLQLLEGQRPVNAGPKCLKGSCSL